MGCNTSTHSVDYYVTLRRATLNHTTVHQATINHSNR